MNCVLDASAVIAYLLREAGWDVTEGYLDAGGCLIHAVNVCEVLYNLRRDRTPEAAERNISDLAAFGVITRDDFDLPFLQIVAGYKTAPGQVSLGDCFGLALAQRAGLPFITSDRHKMTRVAARGTVAIEFIR